MEPLFIVFEGIDGSGKTSVVRRMAEHLKANGIPARISREPSDGPHGQTLRRCMMTERLPPLEELALFIEDRREHIENVISPSLARGETVVLDRYFYSTIAYQGAGENFDPEDIENMMFFAPIPDLVFLLDIDPTTALERINAGRQGATSQYEILGFLERCRAIFLEMAERRLEICVIDARLHPDEIFSTVLRHIDGHRTAASTPQEKHEEKGSHRSNKTPPSTGRQPGGQPARPHPGVYGPGTGPVRSDLG